MMAKWMKGSNNMEVDKLMLTDIPPFPSEYFETFNDKNDKKHYDFLSERFKRCLYLPM